MHESARQRGVHAQGPGTPLRHVKETCTSLASVGDMKPRHAHALFFGGQQM